MPSASEKDRNRMIDWFGSIDEQGPIRVLESRGWTLNRYFLWMPAVPSQTVHEIDSILILFLIDEWDFGGWEPYDEALKIPDTKGEEQVDSLKDLGHKLW